MPIMTIKNLNTQKNRRVKLIKTATSVVDIGQQQGAVVDQSNYVGICLSPLELPVISCADATNVFSIVRSYPYENPTIPMTEEIVLWNGSTDQDSFGFEWLGTDTIDIPDGYDYKDNYRYNGDVPLRYEIKQLPENQDQYRMKFNGQNPTIIQFGDNHYGVCLIADTNVISCDGATTSCELKDDADGVYYASVSEILLNGTSYTRVDENWYSDFNFPPNTVEINRSRRVRPGEGGYYDYYFEVNNLSNEYMRIELIGYFGLEQSSNNTNPTLDFDDGPKAIVCLSPKGNQISCDGATNQLVISASYNVDPVPDERWKIEITDAVTGVLFTSLTNLTYEEPDHLSVSLTKNKTPECPLSFTLENEIEYNTVIQNESGSDVRMKLKFVELVDDGEDLTIEFWVRDGSTPVNWITNVEGEDYELTACLSPTPV